MKTEIELKGKVIFVTGAAGFIGAIWLSACCSVKSRARSSWMM